MAIYSQEGTKTDCCNIHIFLFLIHKFCPGGHWQTIGGFHLFGDDTMVHLGDDVFVHSGDDVYKRLLLCRRLHCLKAGCQAVTGRADEDAAALLMMVMIYVYNTDGHGVCVFFNEKWELFSMWVTKNGHFSKKVSWGPCESLHCFFVMVFQGIFMVF